MCVREGNFRFDRFGDDFEFFYFIVESGGFDFVVFDNVFELFVVNGVMIFFEVVMMFIFEVWQNNDFMELEKKVFYVWVGFLMEFWDGFVFFIFFDG